MRGSLVKRLIVIYLLLVSGLFLLLNTLGARGIQRKVIKDREQELYAETVLIMDEYLERYYDNRITLPELLDNIKPVAQYLDIRLWITSSSGKVVGDTSPLNSSVIQLGELDPDFLHETFHRNVFFKNVTEEPMLVAVVPLTYQYMVKGYVCALVSMDSVAQQSNQYVEGLNVIYLFVIGLLLLVFIGVYFFLIHPLKKTVKAARAYSLGNFEKKLSIHGGGEYKELADIISYMGDTMYRFNEYQREIIANISHDFRSPLTSIKGYAEAIKDGTIGPDQQEKYLDVVLFEVERLTKLTSNLLTLNTFDQKGMILQPAEFELNETIKRLVGTFEGTCKKKHLVIQLLFSSKEILVRADKDKIEQVIYNLVDNAIKFSHTDTVICVSVEEKGRKAMVSVKDEGIGIPKDELTRIWERFYKSDSSRGKDKKGTGLGLSIVKEIISAHKENINVISTEEAGTEFVFTLPLVKTEEI